MRHTFYVQYIFSLSLTLSEIFSRYYAQILKLVYWTWPTHRNSLECIYIASKSICFVCVV